MHSFILITMVYFTNAQSSMTCPSITVNDLGSTTNFSSAGLVPLAARLSQEASVDGIPVRIMDYHVVCDASGMSRNTSSFVSVLVQFQCSFPGGTGTLAVCDGTAMITRQYQFSCALGENGRNEWDNNISGNNLFVQTLNPTATFMTPLDNQCRRCIDDQQSTSPNIDPTTHCQSCLVECNQGQGRCFIGSRGGQCCNFYLEDECVAECPSPLVSDSNFDCGCGSLNLDNGTVSYTKWFVVGSVATLTCNPGYQLLPQDGETLTCTRNNGWDSQNVTCDNFSSNGISSTTTSISSTSTSISSTSDQNDDHDNSNPTGISSTATDISSTATGISSTADQNDDRAITAIRMQLDLIIPATVTPAVILVGVMFTLVLLIVYFIAKKSSRTKNEPDQWSTPHESMVKEENPKDNEQVQNSSTTITCDTLIYADIGLNILTKPANKLPQQNFPNDSHIVQYAAINHHVKAPICDQPPPMTVYAMVNLDILLILLKEEVTPRWYEFGLVVGVPKEEMDHYSVTGCSSDQCLIEVLDYWLRHHPSQLTWKEVAHALKEIKLYQLAEKLQQFSTKDADNNGDHNGIQETSNVNLDMDQVVDTSGPKLPPKPQDFVAVKLLPASECDDRYS